MLAGRSGAAALRSQVHKLWVSAASMGQNGIRVPHVKLPVSNHTVFQRLLHGLDNFAGVASPHCTVVCISTPQACRHLPRLVCAHWARGALLLASRCLEFDTFLGLPQRKRCSAPQIAKLDWRSIGLLSE
jgi:hypothetical protein